MIVQKNAIAVAFAKEGRGLLKVNGTPIEILEPEILRYKIFEPILLLGNTRFANLDIRIRVKGGGTVSKFYGMCLLIINNYFTQLSGCKVCCIYCIL